MSKKINCALLIISIIVLHVASLHAKVNVVPYYALDFTGGGAIPNKGEAMFPIILVNDLGLIVKPEGKHNFVGFYELKYTGPGFHRWEGKPFTDRAMDHILVLRHHFKLDKNYLIKTQFNYTNEYTRTGANEKWGTGLYDFKSYGIGITGVRKFTPKLSLDASFQYAKYTFPNYTDLEEAVQSGDLTGDASVGLQDHTLLQPGIVVSYGNTKAFFTYSNMSYVKQKVKFETVQADGSYDSGLQKDTVLLVGASHKQKILNFFVLAPSISYKIKDSNQNYRVVHTTEPTKTLTSVTDISELDYTFLANYYDYNQYVLSVPVAFLLASKWEVFYNMELDVKTYTSRPPKIGENEYDTSKKHKTTLSIISTGFTFKPNPITRTTIFYTYQSQTSNLTYEGNQPYNYNGHFIGMNFSYSY